MANQFLVTDLPDRPAAGDLAAADEANKLTHYELPVGWELTAKSSYHPFG